MNLLYVEPRGRYSTAIPPRRLSQAIQAKLTTQPLPLVGQERSSGQGAVMICSQGVKATRQVRVTAVEEDKQHVGRSLNCVICRAIARRTRGELLTRNHYTNACFTSFYPTNVSQLQQAQQQTKNVITKNNSKTIQHTFTFHQHSHWPTSFLSHILEDEDPEVRPTTLKFELSLDFF